MTTDTAATPLLSKIAYGSGYYLSYGVVFPTLFLVHAIPGARAAASGFVDGVAAARDYVGTLRQPAATQWESTAESPADQSAAASA